MYRVREFVTTYAGLLIAGACVALVWANLHPPSYHDFVEAVLVEDFVIGHAYEADDGVARRLTLRYLVNDVAMALFFAVMAKELWEALVLDRGALRGRKAATPLVAAAGGMLAPAAVYLGLAALTGPDTYDVLAGGWAIPVATDIALAYAVGRMVFGAGHPALRFLLLLAIADDAAALAILAVAYPPAGLAPGWLLLSAGAGAGAFVLFNWLPRRLDRGKRMRPNSTRMRRRLGLWPYAAAGAASWFGVQQAGLPPALGLLPVIPAIPHADRAFGLFAEAERYLSDLLNRAEALLRRPAGAALFLFGLCNAGAEVSAIAAPTWLVLAGLVIGKPLGVTLFGWLAARVLRLGLPRGMRLSDLVILGCVAGVGFTVPLVIAGAAFSGGATLEAVDLQGAARLGTLFSLAAAPVALAAARLMKVNRRPA
ncbi:sodium/proton antiporter, NhaA family [Rhodovulum sp. ES.010]|uniref:Na+/H+ antiporter NhaA n=1 Tax=Rhodovulum sp. ES.010 TaxID=1882821 RepID=UPI00092C1DAE|nr:Na+/H+ antiporter NhaA [Rhodovulum sp. ES.010]SIO54990.1 sodium/proton antiporter, NhaA family [Rhodovulum sp. ES.010]